MVPDNLKMLGPLILSRIQEVAIARKTKAKQMKAKQERLKVFSLFLSASTKSHCHIFDAGRGGRIVSISQRKLDQQERRVLKRPRGFKAPLDAPPLQSWPSHGVRSLILKCSLS